jgi:hypothetical protein
MSLVKTEKGKEALQSRDPALNPRERQLLILANGTRSRASLNELMERPAEDDIDRLIAAGYLVEETVAVKIPAPRVATPDKTVETMPPPTAQATPKPASVSAPVQQQPLSRRSLAGTKMYMVDMLQFMRDLEASSLSVSLHTSPSEAEFVETVTASVKFIAQKSGVSYSTRIVDKLREIIPEPHLPAIEVLAQELEAWNAEV